MCCSSACLLQSLRALALWFVSIARDHKCSIVASGKYSGEVSLVNNEGVSELFLKWGERNGAEDGNKVAVTVAAATLFRVRSRFNAVLCFGRTECTCPRTRVAQALTCWTIAKVLEVMHASASTTPRMSAFSTTGVELMDENKRCLYLGFG